MNYSNDGFWYYSKCNLITCYLNNDCNEYGCDEDHNYKTCEFYKKHLILLQENQPKSFKDID